MSPRFIFVNNSMIHVVGPVDPSGNMIPEKGYTHGGYVWVFHEEKKPNTWRTPIVYMEDGNLCYQFCGEGFSMDEWAEENIKENRLEDAEKVTKDQITFSVEMIEAMNNATSSYKPVVEETDDFMKRLVKTVILLKGVDLNRLKAKMSKAYGLSNLISALRGKTKMSVTGFSTWVELLGIAFTVKITSEKKEKCSTNDSNLEIDLVYHSSTGIVTDSSEEQNVYQTSDKDDFLKKLIKTLWTYTGATDAQLKSKMTKPYGFSNLKSGLFGSTKMSVKSFLMWLELLEAQAEIIITDNKKDKLDPLPCVVKYRTTTDKITDELDQPFNFS